ncbi:helix-turn-helix transcriptional regulator [soil metagenome]
MTPDPTSLASVTTTAKTTAGQPVHRGRTGAVGELLREWRSRRRRSQMDLAHEVGVSPRHLSFVENGRARPSPELILTLAETLEVPLRERNTLLLAAGHAPRYPESSMDDPVMVRARDALSRMLAAHDPYPGVAIDRQWNVVLHNRAAGSLLGAVPAHVVGERPNVYRICLHPDGLAARTLNFEDWATHLLDELRRTIVLSGDPATIELEREVLAYPNVVALAPFEFRATRDEPTLLVPFRLDLDGHELSMFTTLTTFGTPRDITLDELSVELFFPADDASEQLLRAAAETA